jgi:serine/threonine-protein kinase
VGEGRFILRAGDTVGGRFELIREIGEGGMGRVYEAVDHRYDRPAAVKLIGHDLAQEEEFRRRFEREAHAAERATHPHVLPVWDHGDHNGLLYLATPLCDTDLARLLGVRGRLAIERTLTILTQIAWALDWAHGRGVVHRDVKPENILLVTGPGEDHAYLADFGLAKAIMLAPLTRIGAPARFSPAFAAPEQWFGLTVGPSADQYSLAATLYTCLAGNPPFHPRRGRALRDAHLDEEPPRLDELVDGIPPALAAAVARGLAKTPSERFGKCRELMIAARAAAFADRPAATAEPREASVAPASAPTAWDWAAAPPTALPAEPEPEPGPQPEPPPVGDGPGRSRTRRALVVGGPVALSVAVGLGAALLIGGGSDGRAPIDKRAALSEFAVGPQPSDIVGRGDGSGGIWVANSGDRSVSRIRPAAGVVRPRAIAVGFRPLSVAAGDGKVWVMGLTGGLREIDPRTARPGRSIDLGGPINAYAVAAGLNAVWIVIGTKGSVRRIGFDATGATRRSTISAGAGARDIAIGFGSAWVANSDVGTVLRLAPDGRRLARIRLEGGIESIATGAGAVWVANPQRGSVYRVSADTNSLLDEIKVGGPAEDAEVVAGEGRVYYVNHDTGTATRVDPATNEPIGAPVRITRHAAAATIAGRALWVVDRERPVVLKLAF